MAWLSKARSIDLWLDDPMTIAAMQADHIDRASFRAMLLRVATHGDPVEENLFEPSDLLSDNRPSAGAAGH